MTFESIGTGISQTHVTIEDLQTICYKTFGNSARFGPNFKLTNIGEGSGYLSRIVLVEPDWNASELVPRQFIAKISSLAGIMATMKNDQEESSDGNETYDEAFLRALENNLKMLHNEEVKVYDYLQKAKLHVPLCQVYYSRSFSETNQRIGIILMEYLPDIYPLTFWENLDPKNDLLQVLRAKAKLEAYFDKLGSSEKEQLSYAPMLNFLKSCVNPQTNETQLTLLEKYCNDDIKRLIKKIRDMGECFYDFDYVGDIWKRLGMKLTFVHGDLWFGNMLFRKHSDGSFELKSIIDFQLSHFGHSATDLTLLFISTLSGIDRRNHWERLTETFYEYVEEEFKDSELPYTLEQLKASYREFFPTCGTLTIAMLGSFVQRAIEKAADENEKTTMRGIIEENIQALLEDTISGQEMLNAKKLRQQQTRDYIMRIYNLSVPYKN